MKLNSDKKELQQGSQFNQISSKCIWQGIRDALWNLSSFTLAMVTSVLKPIMDKHGFAPTL